MQLPALLPLLLSIGCAHNPRTTEHLFPTTDAVVAHRGVSAEAPENTLAAFERAVELGIPLELDVHLSQDGQLVVIHDGDLSRTTSGEGEVSETTVAQLATLDAGSDFDARFADEHVPTLQEVFDLVQGRVVIMIEVKAGKGADAETLGKAVAQIVRENKLEQRSMVMSFSPFVMEQVRLAAPELIRGQLYGSFEGSTLKRYERFLLRKLAFNKRVVPDVLLMEHVVARPAYLRRMHRKGYRLFAWTIDDPERQRVLREMGIDGIITNDPAPLLTVVSPES